MSDTEFAPQKSTLSLLVVDDDQDIRDLMADYLRQHGFAVRAADGGDAMFACIEEEKPDLIVLDIMMPGEDGLSLCRRLRAGVSDLLTNGECKVGIEGQLLTALLELSHYLDHNGTAETVIDCLGFHQSVILTEEHEIRVEGSVIADRKETLGLFVIFGSDINVKLVRVKCLAAFGRRK